MTNPELDPPLTFDIEADIKYDELFKEKDETVGIAKNDKESTIGNK